MGLALLALLALAGCGGDPGGPDAGGPGPHSIGGTYILMGVAPSGSIPEPGGGTVSVIGGRLTLGPAAPEAYVYPPSGVPMARSCVHEIPNGAIVDTARVVHLPDGTSYPLPRCGTGTYTLVFIRQHVAADGSSRSAADTSTGLYTWGIGVLPTADAAGLDILTLVDANLAGPVTYGASGPEFRITRQRIGPTVAIYPPDPTYTFFNGRD